MDRVPARPAVARDNADVMETLQRLQAAGQPGFDPYRVQWRSDRLEWVMKNGLAQWFTEEMRAGRVFFPLALGWTVPRGGARMHGTLLAFGSRWLSRAAPPGGI